MGVKSSKRPAEEQLINAINFAVRSAAESEGIKEGIVAVGLLPISDEAKKWMAPDNEGLLITALSIVESRSTEKYLHLADEIEARMNELHQRLETFPLGSIKDSAEFEIFSSAGFIACSQVIAVDGAGLKAPEATMEVFIFVSGDDEAHQKIARYGQRAVDEWLDSDDCPL